MKLLSTLAVLLLSISFYLYHSNSFTTADIRSDFTFSITSEENAFIAISFISAHKFNVINNTNEIIEFKSVRLLSDPNRKINPTGKDTYPILTPGNLQEFTITGANKDLPDKEIHIEVSWTGGSAIIITTIPGAEVNADELDEVTELIDEENLEDGSESLDADVIKDIEKIDEEVEDNIERIGEPINDDNQQVEYDYDITDLDESEYAETETEE